jgi:D-methionine transport system ATP-binding protein
MIRLSNISKIYRSPGGGEVKALSDVSLTVQDGEIYGVIGYSGAGKSTLVRCINFLEIPDSGTVEVSGFGVINAQNGRLFFTPGGDVKARPLDENDLRRLRRRVGMIFQHFNLLDRSTVFQNIAYPLKYSGMSSADIEKRVFELLDLVELADKADFYPSELSGGQKQRVAIARALANNPKILLSDEATSALDPDVTESILELLKNLNRRLGLTVILITHEMAVIKSVCSRVAVMEKGHVVEEGGVYDLFSRPREPITQRFVAASSGLSGLKRLVERNSPLVETDAGSRLVTLHFSRESVGQALISETSRQFDVDLNIVLANVDVLQESSLGYTVVRAQGARENIEKALEFLSSHNVRVEEAQNYAERP